MNDNGICTYGYVIHVMNPRIVECIRDHIDMVSVPIESDLSNPHIRPSIIVHHQDTPVPRMIRKTGDFVFRDIGEILREINEPLMK